MQDRLNKGENKLTLEGPVGSLEAMLTVTDPQHRDLFGIICHPHPLFGGTMQNKVVYTIARAFKDLGIASLRFNFRGVGASEGSYAEGNGEVEDLIAVINWVKQKNPTARIWLAGFSFGSYVATRAASLDTSVEQLITVAPPVRSFNFEVLDMPSCPWLIIQGEEDEVVPPEAVYHWAETLQPAPQLIRIKNASHFFHSKLGDLKDALISALKDNVSQ